MQKKCILRRNQVVFMLSGYMVMVFNLGFWHYLLQHVIFRNNVILWLSMPIFLLAAIKFFYAVIFLAIFASLFCSIIFNSGFGR